MKLTEFEVGTIVTRVKPAELHYGVDRSFLGEEYIVLAKGNGWVRVVELHGDWEKVFTDVWLDGWESIEEQGYRFDKHDMILHDDENWLCIVADDELAVFARTYMIFDGEEFLDRTCFECTFVVSNEDIDDGFEYKLL